MTPSSPQPRRICVIGAGARFLSGISYYTMRLANALALRHRVSVITIRQLLPAMFYPGRARVGVPLMSGRFAPGVAVLDGLDWYWVPSLLRAVRFAVRNRPDVFVFQWWSAAALHSYVVLAWLARLRGARVVIEFHEIQDPGEARFAAAGLYVRIVFPLLLRAASGFVVHSEADRAACRQRWGLRDDVTACIPHGPYDQYGTPQPQRAVATAGAPCHVLFFGVIRPFKGVEDLIEAFDSFPPEEIAEYRLTIVGETWEGWTVPQLLAERSRYRDRITFVNRYVHDDEIPAIFAAADVVALPYRRSTASGPLSIAMSQGLPVIVTAVGGLPEAVQGYEGAVVVPPRNPAALRQALRTVSALRGQRFENPHSWDRTADRYDRLLAAVD